MKRASRRALEAAQEEAAALNLVATYVGPDGKNHLKVVLHRGALFIGAISISSTPWSEGNTIDNARRDVRRALSRREANVCR